MATLKMGTHLHQETGQPPKGTFVSGGEEDISILP